MGVFKEITKADGSGVTVFYRTNLASTFDISDLDIDTESVLYRTGKEISEMTEDKPYIVLCTEDYIYTDQYGSLISVERGTVYEMEHGTVVDAISIGGGGGGGGIPRSNLSTANSPLEQNVSIKASVNLSIHFVTTALKKTGTVKLYVNNALKSTKTVESGDDCEFEVSKYLKLGTNYFTIRTADDNGAEKNFDFLVNAVQLILSSGFNGNIPIPNTFDYIYRIKGTGEKTVHFILDGVDTTTTTTASDVDITQKFTNLGHGAHTLIVYAEAELEGEIMYSNELSYSLLTFNPSSTEIIMLSNFNTETAMEGEQLKIDYLVYNPNSLIASVSMYINDEWIMDTTADRTQHYWTVSNYPSGTVTFKIRCGDTYIEKTVEVEPISVDIQEATEGLELKLTAANRSNQELEPGRSTWHYNDIYCQMNNFNWQSNGWIDGKLKLTGRANVVIPFQPFSTDLRRTGKTIEIEFITYDAFSTESKLISCIDDVGVGFDVTLDKSILASEQESVSTQFGEGTKIRISFVIESTSSNRLIKTYINGVLSGLKQYPLDDNFQQSAPTNIVINPDQEEIDITSIRIYNRALNSKEVVNNWIYDMSDVSEKINAFNKNQIYDYYGNISYAKVKNFLPVVTVIGPMPTYKGDKKKVRVIYEHNLKTNYNFEQENCTIDVQGTSSQYYPRKNWKIKLVDKVQVDDGWLEEKTYCMKADFMESSHTYNIGTATLINDIYDPNHYYPTRTADNGVRDTMNGFPCVLFTKESEDADMYFAGTFMFNNDKADTDTLGYTIDPDYKNTSESWEFRNNTSDHCLFKSADFSPEASPLDDFEARYPDGYEDFTALSRVFEWVVSCKNNPTKFKQEFEQYFNLHYCLVYQVMMELAIMVDSRAKNMFLDTADGIIWYPRFYDMDTCWGLNNEGVPAWSYDVEIHDRIGTAYVWDDRGASEFWNLFEQAYASEIKNMYHTLREEKLTYENILHYYVENISSQFSASEYNEDSEFKYVGPLVDEGNATYLYAAQGNRQDYFRWIVKKRLYYLDSKYEYGDYNNDYATMRWYTHNGDLTITTYQTAYIKVRFGSTDVRVRVEHDTPTLIKAPVGLEFNDTEVIIWGASQITDFGDLTNKYPGTVDVSKCAKLQKLSLGDITGSNTNLVSISLGNNPLLRELYVANCSSLVGSLDLTSCSDLRILDIRGTKLSGFVLPDGSLIEEIYLPKTITTLTFKGMQNLQLLTAESFNSIKTLVYEKSSYSLEDILIKCPSLTRMRLVFDDDYSFTFDIDGIMYYYNNLLGVDEHGYNLPHPYMSGTINIKIQNYHTSSEITQYKNILATEYPQLIPAYQNVSSLFSNFYYCQWGTENAPYKYVWVEEKAAFRRDTNSGVDAFKKMVTYTSPTNDSLFVNIRLSDNASGLIFLPEQVRGVPVYSFFASHYQPERDITGLIVPNSYRMFDLDFYREYNLISPSQIGTGVPCISVAELPNQTGWFIPVAGGSSYVAQCGYLYGTTVVGLRTLVFGGVTTFLPSFSGNYLEAFVDTQNVKAMNLNMGTFLSYLKDFTNAKFIPMDFKKLDPIIAPSHPGYREDAVNLGPLTNRHLLTNAPFGDGAVKYYITKIDENGKYCPHVFDNIVCDWAEITPFSCVYCYAHTNGIDFNGHSIDEIGRELAILSPIDMSGVTEIKVEKFTLPHTLNGTPQYFPDLTHLDVYNTTILQKSSSGNYSSTKQYVTIDAPNLNTISVPYTFTSTGSAETAFNIVNDKLFKAVPTEIFRAQYVDSPFEIGWHAYNKRNPWMTRGIDCSELDRTVILRLKCQSRFPVPTIDTNENVTGFGGLLNYGQAFTKARKCTIRKFDYQDSTVAKSVLLNIFNNLYDISSRGFSCTMEISTNVWNAANLSASDIQIATDKGWTVTTIDD